MRRSLFSEEESVLQAQGLGSRIGAMLMSSRTPLRPKRKCSPESQQQGAELESACEFSSEPGLLTFRHLWDLEWLGYKGA